MKIVGLVIVLGIIVAIFLSPKKADIIPTTTSNQLSSTSVTPGTSQSVQSPLTGASTSTNNKGSYQDYSAEALASTPGKKVLFFHAPWCPQCRALDASIKDGPLPAGVTVFKVDYDSNQSLRQKYGVTIQTTLVQVDDSGKLVKKYNAYSTPSLDALINNVL